MAATFRPSPSHPAPFPPNAPHTPTSISPTEELPSAKTRSPNRIVDPRLSALSPRSPKGQLPRSPQPLTGAAAMTDERRRREQQERESSRQTSPNPAVSALNSLLGNEMSRARDAPPAATAMSEPLQKIAKSIAIPEPAGDTTSPLSLSSFGSLEGVTAPTATASATEASPAFHQDNGPQDYSARSNTFPAPAPPDQEPRHPNRVLSMPMSGFQNSPRSPSTKRHKCPYCATDFTRHHNLKSHLLTHSHEKPYECPTCQSRFRRLHDLKRHTKLHTGERPHTCPKCGRKFARGDALARHNKGQGGCAGRRSSFGIDDDGERDDDGMDGIVYQHDDDRMDDDSPAPRRVSEPSAKGRQGSQSYHQHSSTYPPVARQASRALYPGSMTGTGTASSRESGHPSPKTGASSLSSMHYPGQPQSQQQQQPQPSSASVFAHGGMTESPKPISPGHLDSTRHHGILEGAGPGLGARSPSMSHAQAQFARGVGRGSSPMGLPPPGGSLAHAHAHAHSLAPQLPSLPGLAGAGPAAGKMAGSATGTAKAGAGTGTGPSMLAQQVSSGSGAGSANASASNSLSSHSQSLSHSSHGMSQSSSHGHGHGHGHGHSLGPGPGHAHSLSHGHGPGHSLGGGSTRSDFFPQSQTQSQGPGRAGAGASEADVWTYVRELEARMARGEEEHRLAIGRLVEEVEGLRGLLGMGGRRVGSVGGGAGGGARAGPMEGQGQEDGAGGAGGPVGGGGEGVGVGVGGGGAGQMQGVQSGGAGGSGSGQGHGGQGQGQGR